MGLGYIGLIEGERDNSTVDIKACFCFLLSHIIDTLASYVNKTNNIRDKSIIN